MAVEISLAQLRPHPHNSNVMPVDRLVKLKRHIAEAGRYPPLIVRPLDTAAAPPTYQLLDGHHRAQVFRELGHAAASCEVWDVDDAQALLLLATLNRLAGDDDPHKRASLVEALRRQHSLADLAARLPEKQADLQGLLALRSPPPAPTPATPLEQMPVAVHFFLLPEQRRRLEQRLRDVEGSREAALLHLLDLA